MNAVRSHHPGDVGQWGLEGAGEDASVHGLLDEHLLEQMPWTVLGSFQLHRSLLPAGYHTSTVTEGKEWVIGSRPDSRAGNP
jgi:hypothetical protein